MFKSQSLKSQSLWEKLYGLVGLLGAGLLLGLAFTTVFGLGSVPQNDVAPLYSGDAAVIKLVYEEHEIRASLKFNNKTVVIRGEVTDLGLTHNGKPYVVLDKAVYAIFKNDDITKYLTTIDKGFNMNVICEIEDKTLYVNAINCRMWK